jgi:DNA-binding CsgD family transcriptional regulator
MTSLLKISLRVGSITAGAIILYEAINQLYLYHYFRYEYYLTGAAIVALLTGILLTRKYFINKIEIATDTNIPGTLTAKELSILQLICEGKSNKEIAAINFIELSTVKTHINNIYGKLGVKNRREAMKACQNYFARPKSTLSPPIKI